MTALPSNLSWIHALLLTAAASLQPLVHPDLSGIEEPMRGRLESAISYFEREGPQRDGTALAELFGRLGMQYHAYQIAEPAEVAYRNALQLDPDDFVWTYYLAFLMDETGRAQEAIDGYASAIQIEPEYKPVRLRLGRIALVIGRLDEAEAQFRHVLRVDPVNAPALAGLGRVMAQRGDHAAAIQFLSQALLQQTDANRLFVPLAQSLLELGRSTEADAAMAQAGDAVPFIADPLLALMTARAEGSSAFVERARLALENNQPNAALDSLSIAIEIDPLDLDAQVAIARTLVIMGDTDTAARALELVLHEDPDHRLGLLNLSNLMLRDERFGDAAILLRRVVAVAPDTLSYALLADSLMLNRQYEEAAHIYNQLGRLERQAGTTDSEPYFYAGVAMSGAGQCEESVAMFTLAFTRNPPHPTSLESLARSTATCPASTPEQIADALEMAKALYQNLPSQRSSETYAMALAASGQFDDAIDLQGQAIFEALRDGLLPANPQLQENMQRYNNGEPATQPWAPGHSIYGSTLSGIGSANYDSADFGEDQGN
jgi:tetratricopeptide (TPR) repeat protein